MQDEAPPRSLTADMRAQTRDHDAWVLDTPRYYVSCGQTGDLMEGLKSQMADAERGQVSTAWLIRAGRRGEREELALQIGVSGGGWSGLPDLTAVSSRHQLEAMLRELSPDVNGQWDLPH